MLIFGQSCSGGPEAHELIAVGHRAWASSGSGSWTAATITPAALNELDDEQTDLKGLFAAAENIESGPEEGAVEEGDRKGFLREPVVHGEEEGTGATVTDKYEDVNGNLGIAPRSRWSSPRGRRGRRSRCS
jgi:hypothetical protein